MDLLMRRRALMVKNGDLKIMTSTTNPVIMGLLYNSGKCAHPNYITDKEAANVSSFSWLYNVNLQGEDFSALRFFTKFSYIDRNNRIEGVTGLVIPVSMKTISGKYGSCGVNNSYVKSLYVRIPHNNINFDQACFCGTKTVVIFDSDTVPTKISPEFIRNSWGNRLKFEMYVPDTAVQDYKDLFLSLGDFTGNSAYSKTAQDNANRIYPISQYPYEWTGGYPLNEKLI